MCVCANFQAKQTALTFSAQICLKMNLGLAIQKTIDRIRLSILNILYYYICQFSVKINNLEFFGPNLSKKEFRVGN